MGEVENRIRDERKVARFVIKSALALGYRISVNDGEAIVLHSSVNTKDILAAMFSTDEEKLYFYIDNTYKGMVFFVYGNDASEVINDYSIQLEEPFMASVMKYCERFE